MTLRLAGSTSGYTEIDAPAVAGSNTLVLPGGNGSSGQVLSTNGSGTLSWVDRFTAAGPAFHAYQNASTSLSNSTLTKLSFQIEQYDTNNNFASPAFTPTVAGYYLLIAKATFSPNGTNSRWVYLYKNGTKYVSLQWTKGDGTNFAEANGSSLVYMNGSTDYAEIYVQQNSGSTLTTSGDSDVYFQGFLARPA